MENAAVQERAQAPHMLTGAQRFYIGVKRAADVALSLLGLVLLSPVLLAIGIAIVLDDGFPVLFTQRRVGRGKRPFHILKFRTMKSDTPHDKPTHLLEHPEQYITRVGKVLRKTSLDELPQLLNILTGSLHIVSYRPSLYNQTDLIRERDRCGLHQLRPGLTGWAQIHGRDELPWTAIIWSTWDRPSTSSAFSAPSWPCSGRAAWWRAARAPWSAGTGRKRDEDTGAHKPLLYALEVPEGAHFHPSGRK